MEAEGESCESDRFGEGEVGGGKLIEKLREASRERTSERVFTSEEERRRGGGGGRGQTGPV